MAKFYIQSGDISYVLFAVTALDAVKRFIQLVISEDRVKTGELSEGILVSERGFYKSIISGKMAIDGIDIFSSEEIKTLQKKRKVYKNCSDFSEREPDEDIMFMRDDILRDVGYLL